MTMLKGCKVSAEVTDELKRVWVTAPSGEEIFSATSKVFSAIWLDALGAANKYNEQTQEPLCDSPASVSGAPSTSEAEAASVSTESST